MTSGANKLSTWTGRVAGLSLVLLFFTIPHSLEDFSVGEPAEAGISEITLAFVVAGLIALQGAALFWVGERKTKGFVIHAVLGVLWPLAAGAAQLPVILTQDTYRSGTISVVLVIGVIVVGILLFYASIRGWMTRREIDKGLSTPQQGQ